MSRIHNHGSRLLYNSFGVGIPTIQYQHNQSATFFIENLRARQFEKVISLHNYNATPLGGSIFTLKPRQEPLMLH